MDHSVGVGLFEGKGGFLKDGYSTFSRMFHEYNTDQIYHVRSK